MKLLASLEQGKVFRKDTSIKWKCRNCGYVHEAGEAPLKCPVCAHARSDFEIWARITEPIFLTVFSSTFGWRSGMSHRPGRSSPAAGIRQGSLRSAPSPSPGSPRRIRW